MDGRFEGDQLDALICMVRSLSDQLGAFQREHPADPSPRREVSFSDIAVSELAMSVRGLQRELAELRAELATEIRTGSVVVDDGVRRVVIRPGDLVVERRPEVGDARSGSLVHVHSLVRGAEITVEAASTRGESGTIATVNANWEGEHPVAIISAEVDNAAHDGEVCELRAEDRSCS